MRTIAVTLTTLLFELSEGGAVTSAEPLKAGFVFIAPVDEDVWSYGHNQTPLAVEAQFGNRVQSICIEFIPAGAGANPFIRQFAEDD